MAAHQPNLLPYLGFFDKLVSVNELGTEPGVFVIRDDCQFVLRDWHHRNKIRTNTGEGWMWLYIPVDHDVTSLREIKIRHDKKINGREVWYKYHLRMIKDCYKKATFFDIFYPGIEQIYMDAGDNLAAFNIRVIKYIANCFGITTKIISYYDLPGDVKGNNASSTLANIASKVGADIYLSGDGGREYIDSSLFVNGLHIEFQNYKHPVYPQRFSGFLPYMSSIDALFNVGRLPRSEEVITSI